MNTYIVNEASRNIRKIARNIVAGLWKPAILAVIIYLICTTLPVLILDELFGVSVYEFMDVDMYASDVSGDEISVASGIYTLLVTGPFTLGIAIFFIDLIRKRTADTGLVFAGFGYFVKALGLTIVIGVFTFLWTLLFIVPGIIASLRYSQAYYILADDPNKGIMECIRESKDMMRGNKGKLFCLELSFIGWIFLAALVIGIISAIFAAFTGTGIVGMLIEWVISLLLAGALAYTFAAETVFYEMVNGNLRPQSDELPPLSQNNFVDMAPLSRKTPENEAQPATDYPELKVDNNNDSVNEDKIEF